MRIPIESSTSYRGRNSRPNWLILAAWIGAALAAGVPGALFSPRMSAAANQWYAMLAKPAWAPPNSWFGPVWVVLYVLMGTSAWLIWRERYHRGRSAALAAYAIQLLLNAAWAPLFSVLEISARVCSSSSRCGCRSLGPYVSLPP